MKTTGAIVTVKLSGDCKQRLSPLLSPEKRAGLARAMFQDVLAACARSGVFDRIWVCCAGDIKTLPHEEGVWTVRDDEAKGMKHAVSKLIPLAVASGITHLLAIPSDIPLVRPEDFQDLVRAFDKDTEALLVPSRDGRGTNAIFLTPPSRFPPEFEGESWERNLQTLKEKNIRYKTLSLPTVSLDVDTPADLGEFRRLATGESFTSALIRDLLPVK